MSMMGNLGDKARDAMNNEEVTDKGLDAATEQAKQRAGEHGEKIDQAREQLDGRLGSE